MTGPVDAYLDDLLGELRGPAGAVRRMLAETEAHLREATDEGVAGGLDRDAAERAAVGRFGPPAEVARAANAGATARTLRRLAAPALVAAARLGAIGLVAVGVTGLAATALRAVAGGAFVYGGAYPSASCAHWLSVQPAARTCAQAAVLESADDTLVLRGAAGVLGLLVLGVLAIVARRAGRLPALVEPAVGGALFLAAGAGMIVLGLSGTLVAGGALGTAAGEGQWLASGTVAVLAAVAYAAVLVRRIAAPLES